MDFHFVIFRPIIQEKVSEVQLYEAGTYTTTKYVPKNTVVEKEIKSTHVS